MVDFRSIPQAAIDRLSDCTTAEDVIKLGKQYGIEVTPAEAEAALAAAGEHLKSLASGGCKKEGYTCEDCNYWTTISPTRWCSLHERALDFQNEICGDFVQKSK